MTNLVAAILPLLLGAAPESARSAAEPRSASHELRTNGFAIDSLEIGESKTTVQVLNLMLPATEQFAPNVNVQLQPYEGTLDEYAELSRAQFAQVNAKVLFEKKSGDALLGEYTAELQGRKLHFYTKTLKAGDRIYLATATATETQWRDVGAKLKACVDSFRLPPLEK